ncbi:MAG: peptidoglycan recognition protein family protein [Phycisphaerae bacterium]
MYSRATWMLTALLAAMTAAGCAPQNNEPISRLPMPQPDVSPPAYTRPEPVRTMASRPETTQRQRTAEASASDRSRRWRYIVIHHSATDGGNAAVFDAAHRRRGWDELGYHFVIDNGAGGPDGRVEVGSRWHSQKHGAHCRTAGNEHNEHGIGICLVGDFSNRRPSRAQLQALRSLVGRLTAEYDIPSGNVMGHCEAPDQSTACPGRYLQSYIDNELRPWLRSRGAMAER